MKARIATLIDRDSHMSGVLGDAVVILERAGRTRDGAQRWALYLADPVKAGDGKERAAHNRSGARARLERRKAEGVVTLGGRI